MAHCPRVFFKDDSSESDSEEEGAFKVCTTFHDGIPSQIVDRLEGVHKLLGLRGGLVLDTGIIGHWCGGMPPQSTEVVVRVGEVGRLVSLSDVQDALESIPVDAFQPGRSYVWEDITVSLGGDSAQVLWGS